MNNSKTVFITGASSGIGKAAVVHFSRKGWNVAATMRQPEKEVGLATLQGVKVLKLDVLNQNSIESAIAEAIVAFGRIDVLVNNAGYGVTGPFEAAGYNQIRRQLDTNITGLMLVCKAVIPHFRENGDGTILNISSVGGRITFPFYSLYHATKWAVEGFSESLRYELKPHRIRVKLIEPGAIRTDFYTRSLEVAADDDLKRHYPESETFVRLMQKYSTLGTKPEVVARKIYRAACSRSHRLRYYGGGGAFMMLIIRKIIPFHWISALIFKKLRRAPQNK